jgi:hypothetical protein
VHHLEGAHQQDAALDRRQLVELAVDVRGEADLQFGALPMVPRSRPRKRSRSHLSKPPTSAIWLSMEVSWDWLSSHW